MVKSKATSTRRLVAILSIIFIVSAALAVTIPAPDDVRVTTHQISWPHPGKARVVQLTDLHVGKGTPDVVLERAIEETVKAKPDLVVLTGDYLNRTQKYLPDFIAIIKRLPRPCVLVFGNHDHWSGTQELRKQLEKAGVTVLQNEHVTVKLKHMRLVIVGVDDGTTKHDDVKAAFAGVEKPKEALVLTHHPKTADKIAKSGGRLILAGHLHGGQIDIPKVTDAIAKLSGKPYLAGFYSVGGSLLYVNAGLGSAVVRARAGPRAIPEVAVFDLEGKDK
jgi:predicted MPP superfamily phosphohydrolase